MTNHLHLIANCEEPFQLSDTIRDFKRHSAKTIFNQIQNEPESRRENFVQLFKNATKNESKSNVFKFWKTSNHAIELYSKKISLGQDKLHTQQSGGGEICCKARVLVVFFGIKLHRR